jgi:hypothetical protein
MDFLDSFLAGTGSLAKTASEIGGLYNDFNNSKDPVVSSQPEPKYTGSPENIQPAAMNDNTKIIMLGGAALVAVLAVVAVVK